MAFRVNNVSTTTFQLPLQGACEEEREEQCFAATTCKSLIIGRYFAMEY